MAEAFVAEGIDTVFAVMGDANLETLSAFSDAGIRCIHARHESGAVSMADGYNRALGKVGVAVVTCGPGLTHAVTSLTVAARHGSRVLLYAGDSPTTYWELGGIQSFNQWAQVELTGSAFVPVRSVETIGEDVGTAFAAAMDGPAVLNVATDLQRVETTRSYAPVAQRRASAIDRGVPMREDLADVAALLREAQRPVVIAARGLDDDDRSAVVRLGDRIGALFATTLDAMGAFDDQDWSVGLLPPFAHDIQMGLLRDADVVVVAGKEAARFPTVPETCFRDATFVSLGSCDGQVGRQRWAEHVFAGSAAALIDGLIAELGRPLSLGYRSGEVANELAEDPRLLDLRHFPAAEEPERLDPRRVMLCLEGNLPEGAGAVIGAAHFWAFANMFLRRRNYQWFTHTHDFGCIGQALPTAVGASVAGRGPVVAIEGDGGLMQQLQELDTAARYGLPLLVIVLNDASLGAEYHKLRAAGRDADAALIPMPDLELVCRGIGIHAVTATGLETFAEAVAAWAAEPLPTLIDVHVNQTQASPVYRRTHYASGA